MCGRRAPIPASSRAAPTGWTPSLSPRMRLNLSHSLGIQPIAQLSRPNESGLLMRKAEFRESVRPCDPELREKSSQVAIFFGNKEVYPHPPLHNSLHAISKTLRFSLPWHHGVVYTMDHEVVPSPCKICDWLLNSTCNHFSLHQGKNGRVTMEFMVSKRHMLSLTCFAVGEAKEVL